MLSEIKIEGTAQLDILSIKCICGFCGETNSKNSTMEIDFKTKKFFYLCGSCKKMNDVGFDKPPLPPMPRTVVR